MITKKMWKQIIINMEPFWATRTTKKWAFTDTATKYHDKMNELRLRIWSNKKDIIDAMIQWDYELLFFHEIPKSYSKKDKRMLELRPKETKPDWDNLFKAFTDTIFYKTWINDSRIWDTKCKKLYAPIDSKGYIVFRILD